MRIWLKDIKGMWVATLSEGRVLGSVNSTYLDPKTKGLTGLVVRAGNPLASEDHWIPLPAIRKVGEDLIFLESESDSLKAEPQGRRVADLLGKPVSTQDGKSLGNLTDIEVELETGLITELEVGNGQGVPPDLGHTVLGEDLILVQSGAETEVAVHAKRRESLLRSILTDAVVQQAADKVKQFFKGSEAKLPKPPSV